MKKPTTTTAEPSKPARESYPRAIGPNDRESDAPAAHQSDAALAAHLAPPDPAADAPSAEA